MTPLRLLCLLLYGLVVVGLATLNGALLTLAIPLILFLSAALLNEPPAPQLRVTRSLSSDRAAQGSPVAVRVTIANIGPRLEQVLLQDLLPRTLEVVDGMPRVLTSLDAGASVELAYTVRGRRGIHHFLGLEAAAEEHLGLFRKRAVLPVASQLFILPEPIRLRHVDIRPRQTRVYSGLIPARQGGPGVEFFGVREYQPGDPTRWINPRATARHTETVFVNEFEQERVADVGLILDGRALCDIQTGSDSLFEHAVQATAALATALIGQGNRVGLLVYGNGADWTFPGYGNHQRERILRALARAQTADLPAFESLELMPVRVFPARSQLVLISSLVERDPPALVSLRAQGYQLTIISPDPVAFERRGLGSSKEVALAARIAGAERLLVVRKLRQAGIVVVDWQVDMPFDRVAHAAIGGASRTIHLSAAVR